MKEVLDALKYLFSNGIINEVQFQDFYNRCNTPGVDIESLKNELKRIFDDSLAKKSPIINSKVNDSIDDIDIVEVDDGAEAEYTGVIPINVKYSDFVDEQEVSSGQSKGNQKTLGAHPGAGKLHWGDGENGFTTLMLIMFLTGISVGIVSMIVLNFIA